MQANTLTTQDLDYSFPEELIAIQPDPNFRIMLGGSTPQEISKQELISKFNEGDVLVINNTKVIPRRINFLDQNLDVLFLKQVTDRTWEVMTMASQLNPNEWYKLNGGIEFKLKESGRPQLIELNQPVDHDYFIKNGELALPPYILKMRQKLSGDRQFLKEDFDWYQTEWARVNGSVAAPTASLHFDSNFLEALQASGVHIKQVTLHVGAGTFLPIKDNDLNKHIMHSEWCEVPKDTKDATIKARNNNKTVWALGTTSLRAIESWAHGMLNDDKNHSAIGESNLFIKPGFNFKAANGLLTNFHQPKSTLLALVSAFAGHEVVMTNYQWAIKNKFRLFSYGDLSVWKQ